MQPHLQQLGIEQVTTGTVYTARTPAQVQAVLQSLAEAEEARGYHLPTAQPAFYAGTDLLTFMTVRVKGEQVRVMVYRWVREEVWVVLG